jgi:glucose-6-phosphate 1-dehydrogenase
LKNSLQGASRNGLFYFATPPTLQPIVEGLGKAGLAKRDQDGVALSSVPFGRDLELRRNSTLRSPLSFGRPVYRIDHLDRYRSEYPRVPFWKFDV